MYSEFCQCTIAEVDKYINYKSQGKMLRKKFKSYKPFWNSELTSLWKDMCHKERSAHINMIICLNFQLPFYG